MSGPELHSTQEKEQEDQAIIAHNTRIALLFFLVYVLFYAGFMALSAFWPEVIGSPFLGGVNLSVIYGFGLIVLAIVIAGVYLRICRKPADGGGK